MDLSVFDITVRSHAYDAALITAWGLVCMFVGQRLYRILATIFGAFFGCGVAIALSTHYLPAYPVLHYVAGLAGIGLGGVIAYYLGVFAIGAILGLFTTSLIWLVARGHEMGVHDWWLVAFVAAAIGGGLLAVAFHRPLLIIITSVGGASAALQGAAYCGGAPLDVRTAPTFDVILAGAAFVALSAVGIFVQWKTGGEGGEGRGKPAREKPEKKSPAKKE